MTTKRIPRTVTLREKVLAMCQRHGIQVTQTPGGAWRFFGPSVDLTVTDLRFVYREDLVPKFFVYRRRQ